MISQIACHPEDPGRLAKELEEILAMIETDWAQEVKDGFWKPFAGESISIQGFIIHSRTGKLRMMTDLRGD